MILPPICWKCLTIPIYNLFCFYPMIVGTDRRSQMTWKWLECTRVTSIFKKGNPERLSNYRPIFLLSVFCKLFASLVLSTFRPKIGPYIWKTQLGFEKTHSTQQAVFWARGVQDQAEMSGANLNFTLLDLLDFEKAFDKIDHWKLVEALHRYVQHSPLLRSRFATATWHLHPAKPYPPRLPSQSLSFHSFDDCFL